MKDVHHHNNFAPIIMNCDGRKEIGYYNVATDSLTSHYTIWLLCYNGFT